MSHATVALSLAFSLGLITCVAVSHAAPLPPPDAPQANPHKALLIGVDGLQYEKLRQAIKQGMAPNLARLQLAKSYVGGIDGTTTEQTTGSGPGWTTILTGSWVDRHKVPSNNDEWRNQAPSVFKQLKLAAPQRKTASIVSWNTINHNFTDDIANGYIDLAVDCAEDDQCVADKTGEELEHGQSDLVFVHLDETDTVGHRDGFSPAYQQAIQSVDNHVGQLLAALSRRQVTHPQENWLVIVAPDHGRRLPDGHDHGKQTLSEKTTFIALNKPGNAQLTAPIAHPTNPAHKGLYGYASQADITPTLLAHLGALPAAAQYSMDGLPLTGPVGARQLTVRQLPGRTDVKLTWHADRPTGTPVQIYRNGEPIATLKDTQQAYVDTGTQALEGPVNYTVVVHQVPVSRLIILGDKAH